MNSNSDKKKSPQLFLCNTYKTRKATLLCTPHICKAESDALQYRDTAQVGINA